VIRVLVDTNVVISALLFPNSTPARALALVLDEHRLVLTDSIIDELHEVVRRKRPDLLAALDAFLAGIDYELAGPGGASVPISDPDDQPILDAAVAGAVDAIVTGDRAFLSPGLDRPRILTARDFLDWYPRTGAPPTTRFEEPTS
jgi:predicted nucleic acid-binding protein